MSRRFVDGFLPLLIDSEEGRIIGVFPDIGAEFLLYGGLATGVGSSTLPLDRGGPGGLHVVRLVRRGSSLHLEALARDLGVGGPPLPGGAADDVERGAVADAFARSVIAALPILGSAERAEWAALLPPRLRTAPLADLAPLAAADVFDLVGVVAHGLRSFGGPLPDAVAYAVDPARSAVDPDASAASATGTVLAGTLTIATTGRPPAALRSVVPDARAVTVDQRLVVRPFPDGFLARDFHPRSGSYGKRRVDPTRITEDRALRVVQPRFRTDSPIVFHVDPAIPEPFRSAVVTGAGWWAEAFAAAGRPDGFRVELRDPDVDPWSIDVNPVWWVHRAERGWSMGHAVTDPATGEILRGSVRLGSQRVAQLRMLFEALLAPFGAPDEPARLAEIDAALAARIRLLAAHEVGHALGFVHNYASTSHVTPSVMDYPHPLVSLDASGRPSLAGAYADGIGEWDRYVVAHGYGEGDPDALRRATTLPFLTDADGHAPGASSTVAVPWTLPLGGDLPDAHATLARILAVRSAALARFGPAVAPPYADLGELENRFGLLHLLHRFEAARVARLLGGAEYRYGRVGEIADDPGIAPAAVPAAAQQRAVTDLAALVRPEIVRVPGAVAAILSPPSIRYTRGTATVAADRTAPLADLDGYEAVATAVVATEVFAVERLNRLVAQSAADDAVPSLGDVVAALFAEATTPVARETLRLFLAHAVAGGRLTLAARAQAERALRAAADAGTPVSRAIDAVIAGQGASLPPLPVVPLGAPL